MQVFDNELPPPLDHQNSDALKAFFDITLKWGLSSEEERILLETSKATCFRWKRQLDGSLTPDTLERIAYILGIYQALRAMLPNENTAHAWIRKPNNGFIFGGCSPLEKLLKGRKVDLADVCRYLDANTNHHH